MAAGDVTIETVYTTTDLTTPQRTALVSFINTLGIPNASGITAISLVLQPDGKIAGSAKTRVTKLKSALTNADNTGNSQIVLIE